MKPDFSTKPLTLFLLMTLSGKFIAAETASEQVQATIQEKVHLSSEDILKCDSASPDSSLNRLSLKQAMGMALNCNPDVKAKLAEAPFFWAQREQFALFESPKLEAGLVFPINNPKAPLGYDVKLSLNVADLLQLSSKKKLGAAIYEKNQAEVVLKVLHILSDVKIAYYRYQALLELKTLWQANYDAKEAGALFSKEQRSAGNISELAKAQQVASFKMSQIELTKVESEIIQARLILGKLLSLSPQNKSWKIAEKLPAISHLPSLAELLERAGSSRLEIIAAQQLVASSQSNLNAVKPSFLPSFYLGAQFQSSTEGHLSIGPFIEFGLPFLGHHSSNVSKAQAELKATELALGAIVRNTSSDLEQLYQKLLLAQKSVKFYRTELIPLQERIVAESLKQYNFMLAGTYQLLQQKQQLIQAQKEAIEALRDYWIAHAELEDFLGGPLE